LVLKIACHQIVLGEIMLAAFGPAAGGALLVAAHLTAQFLRYGSPQLALSEMPVVPGRVLRGIVLCRRSVFLKGSYRMMVTCQGVRKQGQRDVPVIIFQAIPCVSADQALSSPFHGAAIPVDLAIPADVPDLTAAGGGEPPKWTLTARAATPGVKFEAEFDLPVFCVENESLIERRAPERGRQ